MNRVEMLERPDWKEKAESVGFNFHTMYGEPYWDESSVYTFSLAQIENDIEDPSTELHGMCKAAVNEIVQSEELLDRLGIPEEFRDFVCRSWGEESNSELYGRFDLVYDGKSPAKMLEYNADTPTSLFESTWFQWEWLEDMIALGRLPDNSDQFNYTYEAMIERFMVLFPPGGNLHFTSVHDSEEDYGTVETMAWAATEAGLTNWYTPIEGIGLTNQGQFVDDEDRVIGSLFKLYPWENMFDENDSPYAKHIAKSGVRWIEPPWKSLVSNKGILPILWDMFPNHPNLLPAYFIDSVDADVIGENYVIKPIFSREGSSIQIVERGIETEAASDVMYNHHPKIVQAYHPLPVFDNFRPIIGAWVVGNRCTGMGVREDLSRITQNLSRFKPHVILN